MDIIGVGFALGSFGPLLASTEQDVGVSRSTAILGVAFMNLAIGGFAPVLRNVVQRIPVSYAMAAGALLSAAGYLGLAVLNYYPLFLLIGAGIALSGLIGPLTVISRWFAGHRGAGLSIVNLPIAIVVKALCRGRNLAARRALGDPGGIGDHLYRAIPCSCCCATPPPPSSAPPAKERPRALRS